MKKGFTLIELIVGVIIFSFVAMSLSVIYATANRHFMQNYRNDFYKNRLTLIMKFISTKITSATEIELPANGFSSNILAFYSNYTKDVGRPSYPNWGWNVGCRPDASQNVTWHYFCLSGSNLYYHTGSIGGVNVCPTLSSLPNWIGSITCGSGGIFLSDNIYVASGYTGLFFRTDADDNLLGVAMRLLWNPPGGMSAAQRPVDETRVSYFTVNQRPF